LDAELLATRLLLLSSSFSSSAFGSARKGGFGIEKTTIDRTKRLISLTCMEVEDENDDEDENDWGSSGRKLRPKIAGIVCIKAID
jgi:hypothetical protein